MACRLAEGRLVHECDRRAAWDVCARRSGRGWTASVGLGCPMHPHPFIVRNGPELGIRLALSEG
eukprot:6555301-Prymnesium_polylepis.1